LIDNNGVKQLRLIGVNSGFFCSKLTIIDEIGSSDSTIRKNEGFFVDNRDGKKYKWVKIGDQIWMAQNLAFKTDKGRCYAYKKRWDKAERDGYLYDWSTAKIVPPKGWHLPTEEEYNKMMKFIAGEENKPKILYDSLKTDRYGLNFSYNGKYVREDDTYIRGMFFFKSTTLWTATYGLSANEDTLYSYFVVDNYMKKAGIKFSFNKNNGLPIRCVKDNP
jgi:uncharacterized protein (TIGR02145 family)